MLRTRIAPTPSGFLHEGNAFNFLLTFRLAKQTGSQVALRIDDVDAQRTKPEFIADIFECLHWLDLQPHSGPSGPDDFQRNYSQSLRLDIYKQAADNLVHRQMAYGCRCSRKDIQLALQSAAPASDKLSKTPPVYPGTCRLRHRQNFSEPYALRVALDHSATAISLGNKPPIDLTNALGDFIIWRKDQLPAYQLTSLIDDLLLGINWIVRGEDLRISSAAQIWLAGVLASPPSMAYSPRNFTHVQFYHHPLLTGGGGAKLSKSDGATSLRSLRKEGQKQALLDRFEAWLESLSPEISEFPSLGNA